MYRSAQEHLNYIQKHKWSLLFDEETHKAKMINELGDLMDLDTYKYCLEAMKNEVYDIENSNYPKETIAPLDEVTKRRYSVVEYKLVSTSPAGSFLEAYSDGGGIFRIDSFAVYENKRHDSNTVYLNYHEAKEIIETLQDYVERLKHLYED